MQFFMFLNYLYKLGLSSISALLFKNSICKNMTNGYKMVWCGLHRCGLNIDALTSDVTNLYEIEMKVCKTIN